jgi:hypothetical protein
MTEKIRDSFIFYRSFYQSAKKLPKEDKAELFDAICSYALDGEEIELSVVPEAIFTVIQPNLDANRRRWENGCKEKKQIISKPEAKDKQTVSKGEGNKDKDVNVDVNKNKNKKGFISPSLKDVKDYCIERRNSVDANKFFDYYSTGNWKDKDGKAVKNWKQKLLSWEGRSGSVSSNEVDSIAEKLNSIAGDNYFKSVQIGEEVTIVCNTGMKTKAYSLPEAIKNEIKAQFNQPINIT